MTYGFTSGGIAMTPLRQRMTEDMQLRGLAPATQQAYLRYVEQLALFTGKSPDLATDEDFRQFFLALHPALVAALAPPPQSPSPPLSSSSSTPSNAPGRASTCFVRVPPRPYRSSSALMRSGAFWINLTTRPTTRVSPPSIPAACGSARASTSRLAGSTVPACSSKYVVVKASKTAISRCPRAPSPCSAASGSPIAILSGSFQLGPVPGRIRTLPRCRLPPPVCGVPFTRRVPPLACDDHAGRDLPPLRAAVSGAVWPPHVSRPARGHARD